MSHVTNIRGKNMSSCRLRILGVKGHQGGDAGRPGGGQGRGARHMAGSAWGH